MDFELNQATKARPRRYVAYYRVSTGRQELSGLGLDAQRVRRMFEYAGEWPPKPRVNRRLASGRQSLLIELPAR
jgi:hypothetical protein